MNYYLAIDIGASSGRHILGYIEDGRLCLEEIYRFENNIVEKNGTLTWDVDALLREVKSGIAYCGELGKLPTSIAIDTWGVDYVLLDSSGREIYPVLCYRDSRTDKSAAEVAQIISQNELYSLTGIQKQNFNTIYQLYADKLSGKLDGAEHFLMMPEYLSYKLTGVMKNEYTNATTTNLVNACTGSWDDEIISRLGLPRSIFSELSMPGETVGGFTDEVRAELGFDSTVVLCPSHDTASAVAACPIDDSSVYISSGTWSLVGTENREPCLSDDALLANFTNEGGIEHRFRFLKNIMGMWLFQSVRRELGKKYSYDEMMEMALSSSFTRKIDPTAPEFLSPKSMIGAVKEYLGEPELPLSDVLSSLYHSLADSYRRTVEEIERISRKRIDSIHIVGGGSKDAYLNRLTASYTGKRVYTGLMEATATGNLISQIMRADGITLAEAREIIKKSIDIKEIHNEQIR